jgi:MFS transporter, SP family, galactose:H+ symporter
MKDHYTGYTIFSVIVATIGGFLFGYHTAVISGALIFLAPAFHLSPVSEGFVVSIILLGALGGAMISGALADFFGRKRTLLMAALLFILGAMIISVSDDLFLLSLGRVITGVAVGIVSLTSPLYISEISPPHYRGRFVSLNQLATAFGILVAYTVNLYYSDQGQWRMMFAVGAIPALIQVWALYFIPETPSWLLVKRHEEKAISALQKLRKDLDWKKHLKEMKESAASQKKSGGGWSALLKPRLRYVLLVGILLNCFQQITGINTVFYYAPKIFQIAGFGSASGAIMASLGLGIVNVLFSILSVWLLDKLGRRPLLIWGMVGMVVSLLVLSLAFFTQLELIGVVAVISLMAYVASFAVGLGPIPSLLLSEIYPLKVRGKAMTVGTMANWLFNYIISLTFLDLMDYLGSDGTFCLYAVIGLVALWFFWRYIPETKGKTLEEIEASLT